MNRRNFLGTILSALGAAVAVRRFPFSVYSFPSEIKPLNVPRMREGVWCYAEHLRLNSERLTGVFAVQDSYYIHPDQMAELKKLGIVNPVEMRAFTIEGPLPGRGSEVRYNGLRVIENRFVPNLPQLFPAYRHLVPNVPDLYPLRSERLCNPFPHPSRFERT